MTHVVALIAFVAMPALGFRVVHRKAQQDSCGSIGCGASYNPSLSCQCNNRCREFGNCCDDYETCETCSEIGCGMYNSSLACQCNTGCRTFGDCCDDYGDVCEGGGPPDPSPTPPTPPSPSPVPPAPTPGAECLGSVTLISSARNMISQTVTVRGVVTAVFPGLSGYYLQDAYGGDGNPETSDGVFVSDSASDVRQGDLLEMRAQVSQSFGNTQLTPSSKTDCGKYALPRPVVVDQLPVRGEADAFWAPLQGMLITVSAARVTSLWGLQRFGELDLTTGGRLMIPSQVVDPFSSEYDELLASYRDTLTLASGSTQQNPDPVPFPGSGLAYNNSIRVGDSLLNITGPLGYRFSKHLLDNGGGLPSPVHLRANPRPEGLPEVGGRIKISVFNVENYFNGPPLGVPFGDSRNRGASSESEFERQKAKVLSAMAALDAAVFALSEVENNGNVPGSAVQDIVDALNEVAGAGTYATMALPDRIGTDAISNNFIYQPGKVSFIESAILDPSVDSMFLWNNRPAVAASFQEVSSGNRFTVVACHMKSKGSSCQSCCNDPDSTRTGNCNGVRTNASIALGRWLQSNPTGVATDDILITGDMNSYAAEPPIQALVRDYGYIDMLDSFISKEEAYSYVFSGQSGYLDHALASPSFAAKITGIKDWHINADESGAFGYSTAFKSSRQVEEYYAPEPFRSSDHDPLVLGVF